MIKCRGVWAVVAALSKRQRVLLAGLALCLFVGLTWFALLVHYRDRVTPGNYSRLRLWMTTEEVIGILGEPTKRSTTKGLVLAPDHYYFGGYETSARREEYQDFTYCRWEAERFCIGTGFNPEGRAYYFDLTEDKSIPLRREQVIRHLRQWLGF